MDERYHLEKSTRAAAKFMKRLYEQLDSWTLAAAAYNRGLGGVRSKKTAQRGETYYDLFLNEETSRYVFRIIALKDIHRGPEVLRVLPRRRGLRHAAVHIPPP